MIFIFLAVIVCGLCLFGVEFFKELRSGAWGSCPIVFGKGVSSGLSVAKDNVPGTGILGERELERMTRELSNERAHRGEFENVKDILQGEIEALKTQNRILKEDLLKALQANIDLQVKVHVPVEPAADREEGLNTTNLPTLSLHDIFDNNNKKGS